MTNQEKQKLEQELVNQDQQIEKLEEDDDVQNVFHNMKEEEE